MKRSPAGFYRTLLLFLGLGGLYWLFVKTFSLYIPCPIRMMTGWVCPGCGISHFFVDLLQLRFGDAVRQNLAVAVLLPVWLVFGLMYLLFRPAVMAPGGRVFQLFTWVSLLGLLVFGILRNLEAFSFLLPLYLR